MRPARVRRLAGGVHQSVSNEIIVEDKHKKPKDQAPLASPPKRNQTNLSKVLRAPPMLYFFRGVSPAGATSG